MNGFITLVLIIISVIGWLHNAMNENKKKGKVQRGQQRPQGKRRLQDELESFLNELQGQKPERERQPADRQQRKPQQAASSQRKQQSRKRRRSESKTTSGTRRKSVSSTKQPLAGRTPLTQRPEPRSVFSDESSHHVGSEDLGMELEERIEQFSSHHPGTLVDELKKKERDSQLPVPKRSASARRNLFELLHSADSLREAVVLSEILQPPVSQRRRD